MKLNYLLISSLLLITGCQNNRSLNNKNENIIHAPLDIVVDKALTKKTYKIPSPIKVGWDANKYPTEAWGHNLSAPNTIYSLREYKVSSHENFDIVKPVVVEDSIFILNSNGEVLAFDYNNGKQKWKNLAFVKAKARSNKKPAFGGMLYHKGALFVTAGFREVAAIDVKTGTTLWIKKLSAMVRGVPGLYKNKVIVQSVNNNVYALNIKNGEVEWTSWGTSSEVGPLDSPVLAIVKDSVVVQNSGNSIKSLNIKDGKPNWEMDIYQLSDDKAPLSSIYTKHLQVTSYKEIIYVFHPSGRIGAINSKEGSFLWHLDFNQPGGFWICEDLMFVASNNNLVAIDRLNGKVKWMKTLSLPNKAQAIYQPLVIKGQVWITLTDGSIQTYAYEDGSFLGSKTLTNSAALSPVIAYNQVFMITKDKIQQFVS